MWDGQLQEVHYIDSLSNLSSNKNVSTRQIHLSIITYPCKKVSSRKHWNDCTEHCKTQKPGNSFVSSFMGKKTRKQENIWSNSSGLRWTIRPDTWPMFTEAFALTFHVWLLTSYIIKMQMKQSETVKSRGYNVNPFSGLGLKPRTHFLEYRAKALPFRL